jgi:hypothetical protein
MSKQEASPSGQPIYRHEERIRDIQPAAGNVEAVEKIGAHIEKYIGKIEDVFHEMISDLVHLDIFMVAPTEDRNYYTLVTCGMSNLAMTVPQGAEEFRYAELMICLPPAWKLSQEAFQDERNYWPVRCLKLLARMPHEYVTWLYIGHTIPNGNPADPYAGNTKLSGMMLAIPTIVDDLNGFFNCRMGEDKNVHFYSLMPLYNEEMDYKLKHGADSLFEKFDQLGINEVLDVARKNVCKKSFWLF